MPKRKIKDLLKVVCLVLGTSEEIIEKIHRKTLDENKQLALQYRYKILPKGLLSDGITCEFFLPTKYFGCIRQE